MKETAQLTNMSEIPKQLLRVPISGLSSLSESSAGGQHIGGNAKCVNTPPGVL
jgi:hypothetical protein